MFGSAQDPTVMTADEKLNFLIAAVSQVMGQLSTINSRLDDHDRRLARLEKIREGLTSFPRVTRLSKMLMASCSRDLRPTSPASDPHRPCADHLKMLVELPRQRICPDHMQLFSVDRPRLRSAPPRAHHPKPLGPSAAAAGACAGSPRCCRVLPPLFFGATHARVRHLLDRLCRSPDPHRRAPAISAIGGPPHVAAFFSAGPSTGATYALPCSSRLHRGTQIPTKRQFSPPLPRIATMFGSPQDLVVMTADEKLNFLMATMSRVMGQLSTINSRLDDHDRRLARPEKIREGADFLP
ncbi:hypothetical protein GUJ93_ZPchr0001g30033 [Zizania palustris]|uniref:Uncharacterized protein n=1 Tax=Zizania palustris TaxID=103762 RepID=A0A8J5RMQ0_ZIZPA|nr:hypothetical protein GUJ93_ZPchr0001g30033 [Zizania palustris]